VSTGERAPDEQPGAEPDTAASIADALIGIEAQPIGERAPAYDTLAERLRAELERSDPAGDQG
jgi:hypothetical protein